MLNTDQQLVVDSISNTLVVAIPGSGKTEISSRYAEKNLSQSRNNVIMMLTFTDASAKSMATRLDKNLGVMNRSRALSSTFHTCAMQLFKCAYKGRKLIMGFRQEMLIERCVRDLSLKMSMKDAVKYIDEMGRKLNLKRKDYSSSQLKLFDKYNQLKSNQVDFNEVSREVIIGIRNKTIPSLIDINRVTHICADEFQDCDELQYEFLKVHHELGAVILAVGDDDQSIYGFRDAGGYDNFLNFQTDFNAKAYALKVCYRCYPRILQSANNLISFNNDRVPKQLNSSFDCGGEVSVHGFYDGMKQENFVINDVLNTPNSVAILARTNKELDDYELALTSHGIKPIRIGGKSFWENVNAVGYLQLIAVAAHTDGIKFLPDFLGYLKNDENVVLQSKKIVAKQLSRHDTLSQVVDISGINIGAQEILEHIQTTSTSMCRDAKSITSWQKPLVRMITQARGLKKSSVAGIISDIITQSSAASGSFSKAVFDLVNTVFFGISRKNIQITKNDVVISTLHGSKGLEFGRVHIINIIEDKIPAEDKDVLGMVHVEEERRLFYVGITRAEKRLYLHFVSQPSYFLKEAECDLTKKALLKLRERSKNSQTFLSEIKHSR